MHDLGANFEAVILDATQARSLKVTEIIQQLWSGYGKVLRIQLREGSVETVVVKHVCMPNVHNHPRGWNSTLSHERKVRSYEVEIAWYRDWSERCISESRLPRCLAYKCIDEEVLIVLEDLDQAGFPARLDHVEWRQIEICLWWLAQFHAIYMGEAPRGLWSVGTYWHLETRPEELASLKDLSLKGAAHSIDARLKAAQYQTFVHGDAKLANFCFSEDGERVAAVDFQYVGGGCGMKDVAYFIGSCLNERACARREEALLDCYFTGLRKALAQQQPEIDALAVVTEWRELFPWAWTDFHRFLKGWSPRHWKINGYSERLAAKVVASL